MRLSTSFRRNCVYYGILAYSAIAIYFIFGTFKTGSPEKILYKQANDTIIIVITPTHKRLERIADITRLSQTLSHVKNLHWIVVEDNNKTILAVDKILIRSKIPFVYLATLSAPNYPKRGWTHRNLALQYVRNNYRGKNAVVYFGDDDNTYDIRLFDNIRRVKRIGIWAVGLVGGSLVEAPHVVNDTVVSWDVSYMPTRQFATDMAGFAIHLNEIGRTNASFNKECTKQYRIGPESCFLQQFGIKKEELEPFGHLEKEILVWHTRTVKSTKLKGPDRGYVIEI